MHQCISPSGVVRAVNDAAVPPFPAVRAGAPFDDGPARWLADAQARWLADAQQRFTDPLRPDDCDAARGPVGGRSFEARPSRAENGDVMWRLVDDTPAGRRRTPRARSTSAPGLLPRRRRNFSPP
ncbi:hypothetical protein [Streptomyces nigrescens]